MVVAAPSILFVCLGNICRSPTAEGGFRHVAARAGLEVTIDSAGTAAYHAGELPDPRTRKAAEARGIVLRHRARQVVVADFARFDWVLAMDRANREDLVARAPGALHGKVRLFRSFDPTAPEGAEVPDPYYGGADGFEEVLDQCERASEGLLEFLRTAPRT
jgi:protein-tyrosine phosphatase